jgi:hypothetical protein
MSHLYLPPGNYVRPVYLSAAYEQHIYYYEPGTMVVVTCSIRSTPQLLTCMGWNFSASQQRFPVSTPGEVPTHAQTLVLFPNRLTYKLQRLVGFLVATAACVYKF